MTASERLRIALRVLDVSRADATEATVTSRRQALTRFTHEAVSQNVDTADVTIRLRAVVDGRTGIASTNAFDDDALEAVVARAYEIATFAPREEFVPVFASASSVEAPAGAYVAATADATPNGRAAIAGAIFAQASANGLWSSGYAMTSNDGITIATTAGAHVSFDSTDSAANVKMNASDSTGFAERYVRDFAQLDGAGLGGVAADIAVRSAAPIAVEPGDWTVILAPAALGELLRYLTGHFSAETFSDGSSFVSGKLGAPVLGSNVTICDDYAHPLHAGAPFDAEGFPTQRVTLVDGGIANDIVTDSNWARRLKRRNTGHALPPPNPYGPQSNYTVVTPGTKSLQELIAETPRGLLVTRLWYVRSVDQRTARLTGMTRDGTFLIENGVVRGGVHNMRFNDSIVRALSDCELADTQRRTGGYNYSLVTPAVKFNHFHFASTALY